jgi:hypothetical protein
MRLVAPGHRLRVSESESGKFQFLRPGPGGGRRCADMSAEITPKDAPIPTEIAQLPKFAVIGGSGVTVSGKERFSFNTPFGYVINISFLDSEQRVMFVNRHLSTKMDSDGVATYAPPHEVNFHALLYAMKKLNVKGICAVGSVGTLRPTKIPVGSIVMPDDYIFVLPTPVTFWGKCEMGLFEPSETQEGRIHFAPATGNDTAWVEFRRWVQQTVNPVLSERRDKVVIAPGQTDAIWPCVETTDVRNEARAHLWSIISDQPMSDLVRLSPAVHV